MKSSRRYIRLMSVFHFRKVSAWSGNKHLSKALRFQLRISISSRPHSRTVICLKVNSSAAEATLVHKTINRKQMISELEYEIL